jgi:hypothetical protein
VIEAIVIGVTLVVLGVVFVVVPRLLESPERVARVLERGYTARIWTVAGAPEHVFYARVVVEPAPDGRQALLASFSRPSASDDFRSVYERLVEDAILPTIASWAKGQNAQAMQDAAGSASLWAACDEAAGQAGLCFRDREVISAVPLQAELRNLSRWLVNGADYDRGGGKVRSGHLNALEIELDARGPGLLLVRSLPLSGGAYAHRRSQEIVDDPSMSVATWPVGELGPKFQQTFAEMRGGKEPSRPPR